MSCSGTRLCAASMTKASWEPCSQCGSGISSRFCTLTTQSADSEDLDELPTAKSTDIRTQSNASKISFYQVLTIAPDFDALDGVDPPESGQTKALQRCFSVAQFGRGAT